MIGPIHPTRKIRMLELRDVCKRFCGIVAVENVSFLARPGGVTGYLGPNGSGKSGAQLPRSF